MLRNEHRGNREWTSFGGDEPNLSRIYGPATFEHFGINLRAPDGRIHVLSVSMDPSGRNYCVAENDGDILEELVTTMQLDGRQIVDISSAMSYASNSMIVKSLIIYK